MALRAPLLLFVRLAAAPEINALTTQFHEVLGAVENMEARFVVVALDANPNLRNQIEAACVRHGVLMFQVPRQDELRNAAHVPVPVVACAIVGAPRGEVFTHNWITAVLNVISGLEGQLGYQPRV